MPGTLCIVNEPSRTARHQIWPHPDTIAASNATQDGSPVCLKWIVWKDRTPELMGGSANELNSSHVWALGSPVGLGDTKWYNKRV